MKIAHFKVSFMVPMFFCGANLGFRNKIRNFLDLSKWRVRLRWHIVQADMVLKENQNEHDEVDKNNVDLETIHRAKQRAQTKEWEAAQLSTDHWPACKESIKKADRKLKKCIRET